MFHYKRLYVWYNSLQNKWIVQDQYEIVGQYNTQQGAKSAITQKHSKQ